MSQDFATAKLPADDTAEQPASLSEPPRIRRRLGDWQIGGVDATGAFELAEAQTAPFAEPSPSAQIESMLTTRLQRLAPLETRPIGRSTEADSSAATVPLAAGETATVSLTPARGTGSFTERLLSGSGAPTAPIDHATAATAPLHRRLGAPRPSVIPALEPSAVTAPIAIADAQPTTLSADMRATTTESAATATTRPIHVASAVAVAAASAAASTQPAPPTIGDAEATELDRLRERASANPSDSDALFELSVALHRAGARGEARTVLNRLVELYEQRGQHQQAARIKVMLGAPKTGPIGTEELPPRPSTANGGVGSGKTSPLARRTERAGAVSGRTGSLDGRTVMLPNPTAAIGRAKEQAKSANVLSFPPEAMLFTIPLPNEETLTAEVRSIIAQSVIELNDKHYLAAFDSCVQVIALEPGFTPIYLRLAEIFTRQRLTRRARAQAEALIRLADASNEKLDLWMVYRVLLHATGGDTGSLKRLVELLIDAGQTEQASIYASRLIQVLDGEGLDDEALTYSIRLCEIVPGDTRAALENAILRLKAGDRGGALDRWESAVAAGANSVVAKASVAALTTAINEDDHWRILSEVVPVFRQRRDPAVIDAYVRTAAVMPDTPTLLAGSGLLAVIGGDAGGRDLLAQAAGARSGAPISRAIASIALAWSFAETGRVDEYVASVRTALKLLKQDAIASHPAWPGLLERVPRFEDLSLELGEALLEREDAAGAAEVLAEAHAHARTHGPICERLAEAYFKTGQLGSALTVLDELAVHFRGSGQLEAMAGVLRQMSQLAPNNIKVKSRLIDAYLQRGFVAEARAELIQRADLEERSGLLKDASGSLQRAAELSWTIGMADETFSIFTRVIAMNPDDVGNRSALVNYYLQMGKLTEAAEHQRAVVDIALRQGNKHEAIAALHQVIGLTPDDTSAYYQLADLLGAMGEYHQAERVYRRIVLMHPTDAIAQAKATSMAALRESQTSQT